MSPLAALATATWVAVWLLVAINWGLARRSRDADDETLGRAGKNV
jgi:hypothetical protein